MPKYLVLAWDVDSNTWEILFYAVNLRIARQNFKEASKEYKIVKLVSLECVQSTNEGI